jgi:hypothetical protein
LVPRRLAELCLFWSRQHRDAQQQVGVYSLEAIPVHVDLVAAAVLNLEGLGDRGAKRLASRLRRVMVEQDPQVLAPVPETMQVRSKLLKRQLCAYIVEPLSGLRCRQMGRWRVDGARGSFCQLHARRKTIAKEAQQERAAKAKALGERRRSAAAAKRAPVLE